MAADDIETLVDLLRTAAERWPDEPAVVGERAISRAELLAESGAIAATILDAAPDLPAGQPVALLADHGVEAVVGMAAILQTGRPYTVLEGAGPDGHLAGVLEQAGSRVLVTDPANRERAAGLGADLVVVGTDERWGSTSPVDPAPTDLATVGFTSGSTGRPKGVVHDHRTLALVTTLYPEVVPLEPGDHVGGFYPFGFLASFASVFSSLRHGAVLRPYDLRNLGPDRFGDWATEGPVRILPLTPAGLRVLTDRLGDRSLPEVRTVTMGADRVLPADVERGRRAFPNADLIAMLGASEAFTLCWHTIADDDTRSIGGIPVGVAGPNKSVRVVDEHEQDVDDGVVGELLVYGEPIARGYWNDPELTAAAFGEDERGRYFRARDLVRRRGDGCLEFLGRSDDRLKIRGLTVEVAEVETAIATVPGVQQVGVAGVRPEEGEVQLVAHLVLDDPSLTTRDLRRRLAAVLPAHLIPSGYVVHERLPQNQRGKIDRRALAGASGAALPSGRTGSQQPRNDREATVVAAVEEVLGLEGLTVDDDFFELGGDSLAAMELATVLSDRLGVDLPIRALVADPVLENIARTVSAASPPARLPPTQRLREGGPGRCVLVAGAGGTLLEFAPLVRRLPPGPALIGVEARGTSGRGPVDRRVGRMARRVVDAAGPAPGPVVLVGYSLGGAIVVEAAALLSAAGRAPVRLVLVDAAPPRAGQRPEPAPDPPSTSRSSPLRLAGRARRLVRYGPARLRRQWRLRTVGLRKDFGPQRYADLFTIGSAALRRYDPAPWPGPVVILRSQSSVSREPLMGWGDVFVGDVEVIDVGGDHETMLQEPWVAGLADVIAAVFAAENPH